MKSVICGMLVVAIPVWIYCIVNIYVALLDILDLLSH